MQAELNSDSRHDITTNELTCTEKLDPQLDESSRSNVLDTLREDLDADDPNADSVFHTETQDPRATKECSASCLEDISRLDRNSGALTELATGSLATCTSILEVGKDDSFKQRNPNSAGASKIRLYFVTDRCPKAVAEAKKLTPRVSNGSENVSEFQTNAHTNHSKLSSISKLVSQDSRTSGPKSTSCNSAARTTTHKSNVAHEEKSDFCKVYSQEYRLGVSKGGLKSPKSSATRKSVIELKSKSLDPPPSSLEGEVLHDDTFRSAWTNICRRHPPLTSLHPSSIKRRESETAVFSAADNTWLRRISDSPHMGKTSNMTTSPLSIRDSCFESSSSNLPTPPTLKTVNIQKLKAFFGETTPKIIEGKALSRHQSSSAAKDDSTVESSRSEFSEVSGVPCRCASTSSSFDPTSWALEKMSKARKSTSKPLSRVHQELPSRGTKKGLRDRDPSFSPKQYQKEHKTWKGKMVQTLKRYGSGATPTDSTSSEEYFGALGVPLEHCVSSFANEFVPLIVETCTRIVEEKGLENVGVYRVPGNSGAVNALIEELNKDPDGLCLENEKWQDVNLVSSLLKFFFRKLPDSLISDDLYDAIIAANRIEIAERRMLKMKKLIHELPEHNFETLRFLAQHLNRVASREEINKMDAHNLAIVFGPTLVRPQEDSMVVMVKDMFDQCKVIESIIIHCDWFFSSWDEDVYVPVDGEDEEAIPISGMNNELLAKAERLDYVRFHLRNQDMIKNILQDCKLHQNQMKVKVGKLWRMHPLEKTLKRISVLIVMMVKIMSLLNINSWYLSLIKLLWQ